MSFRAILSQAKSNNRIPITDFLILFHWPSRVHHHLGEVFLVSLVYDTPSEKWACHC
jgi:hypothetical protein